ncbi:hypothetical protein DdX_19471 [Ditylenchus destructor]|uniref:Uncharacterized protein n=1 Tax=Ditylenchus destructor TaxID=166010 RepID=A0AAD4MHU6_9BILA|nr:hypothetical protein DdX_19471 [Ditylenchus destructor]
MSSSMFLFVTVIMVALVQVQATEHKVTYTVNFINEEDGSSVTQTYSQIYNDTDVKRGDTLVKIKALSLINTKVPGFGFTPGSITVFDPIRDANGILSATITLHVPKHLGKVN